MALLQHDLKEDQQVQVDAGKVNLVQHVREFLSLDSARFKSEMRFQI
jgi:hypothetical protein